MKILKIAAFLVVGLSMMLLPEQIPLISIRFLGVVIAYKGCEYLKEYYVEKHDK